ncbi:aryl-sulfate sulfotransferase [Bacteroidota bacterium]
MIDSLKLAIVAILLILISTGKLIGSGDLWTVDVLDNPAPGYLILDLLYPSNSYIMDNYGSAIYADTTISSKTGIYFKLLPNDNWLYFADDRFYLLNSNHELIDSILAPQGYNLDFHDVILLSNGHYMAIVVDTIIMDLSDIVDGGDEQANVIITNLVEIDRTGYIYWEWNALDHLEITDVTDDVDLTQNSIDFNHINALTIDLDDNILISSRHLDEITKINKTTGDIIWRMGGSTCRNNEFLFIDDDNNGFYGFSHQHNITILPNGNLLLYDNGNMKEPPFSRAVEYLLNQTTKTATRIWDYRTSPDIFTEFSGSAYRLPNGNTLINFAYWEITEVRQDKSIAFRLKSLLMYRVYKHIINMDAVSRNINGSGNYNFNESGNNTNITINVEGLTGNGNTSIEKHYYSPLISTMNNELYNKTLPYRWVFSQTGITNLSGTIKIDISTLDFDDIPANLKIYKREREASGVFSSLNTSYNKNTNELSANFTDFGEFIICTDNLHTPELDYPENESIGETTDGFVKWRRLAGASKYSLQISQVSDFQENDIDSIIESDTVFHYSDLSNSTQYYWRVRAMNDKDTSDWSDVYSFTTNNNTDVKENEQFHSITILPNPIESRGVLSLMLTCRSDVKMSIINLSGIMVKELEYESLNVGVNLIDLEVADLVNGIYILKVSTQDGFYISKLTINK